jgi:hypothetical protein
MIVTDDNLRRWKFVCENRENPAPSGQSGFSDDVVLSLIQLVEDQKDVVALRESEIAELRTSGSKQLTEVCSV